MIAAKDSANISRLLKQLSRDSSTENTIAFFADNGGMLQSCKKILAFCGNGNEEVKEWLRKECDKHGVQYGFFLQAAGQVLQLFQQDDNKEDNYKILGLSTSADLDEVKRAYRKLSARYHPDTADKTEEENATEQFIRINKAYQAIMNSNQEEDILLSVMATNATPAWQYGNTHTVPGRTRKKTIFWISLLALLTVGASILISQIYSRKVMIATLHQNSAAFVPPAKKNQENTQAESTTFAERMKVNESKENERIAARRQEEKSSDATLTGNVTQPAQQDIAAKPEETVEEKIAELSKEPEQTVAVEVAQVDTLNTTPVLAAKQEEELLPAKITAEKSKIIKAQDDKSVLITTSGAAPQIMAQQSVAAAQIAKKTTTKEQPVAPDKQQRIDKFLLNYCQAYGNKNLMEFMQFFTIDATENGTPVLDILNTYTKLFESTKNIAMQISTLKWEESPQGITLEGRFKVDLNYTNVGTVYGRGKIDFLLIDNQGKLQISKMTYSFD
jgi:hypothetical protein